MAENTIYSDEDVSVTETRVIIKGTTYALRNITSVKMTTSSPKQCCPLLLAFFGAFVLLCGMAGLSQKGNEPGGVAALTAACGIFVAVFFWYRNLKPSYHVTVASASGEAHALTSKEKTYIETIVNHINDAIVNYK